MSPQICDITVYQVIMDAQPYAKPKSTKPLNEFRANMNQLIDASQVFPGLNSKELTHSKVLIHSDRSHQMTLVQNHNQQSSQCRTMQPNMKILEHDCER